MKKIALVATLVLALGAGATAVYATTASLVGARVQGMFSVEVDGEKISDAVVINGSTYVPLRSLSDNLGLGLGVEGKKVVIKTEANTEEDKIRIQGRISDITSNINAYEYQLSLLETFIADTNTKLEEIKNNPLYDELKVDRESSDAYKSLSATLADYNAQVTELKTKIAAADAEIAQLQSQI